MRLPIPAQPVMIPGTDKILSNLENIPDELKVLEQWVLYGDIGVENPRTGEIVVNKKQPLRIPDNSGTVWNAASNKPDTWTDFATAHHHLKESLNSGGQSISNEGQYLGVGFVAFHPDTPYVVIDIDDCIDYAPDDVDRLEPRVEPHFRGVIDKLGTYTEISPSGNGLRCILKYTGSIDTGEKHKTERRFSYDDWSKSIHLELYGSGQYGRMTGNLLDPALNQISEQNQLYESLWMKCEENRTQSTGETSGLALKHASNLSGKHLSDNDVLKKLNSAGNKDKFKYLFNYSGSISGDDSADDMALAQQILFYCGNEKGRDLEQCLRILRQSPRWNPDNRQKMKKISAKHIRELQEKAVNKAYDRLLQDAEKGTASVWAPKKRISTTIKSAPGTAQLAAKAVNAPANQPEKHTKEETSILYSFYDSDKDGNIIKGSLHHEEFAHYIMDIYHVININNKLFIYNNGVYEMNEHLIEKRMIEHIPRIKINERKETLEYIKIYLTDLPQKEADPRYMAFNNCVVDLMTKEQLPFTPERIITFRIPHNYDLYAYDHVAEKALLDFANGNEDRLHVLHQMIGSVLYPSNLELKNIWILYGRSGDNGKSTFMDMLGVLAGTQNTVRMNPSNFKNSFMLGDLEHKLINIMDDLEGTAFDNKTASLIRQLSSGNSITTDEKNKKSKTITPTGDMFFSFNSIPYFGTENVEATVKRMNIVHFQNHFTGDNADPNLNSKLHSESSMEYLCKVGVDAMHLVLTKQERKFSKCKDDMEILEDYRDSADPMQAWFNQILKDTGKTLKEYFTGKDVDSVFNEYLQYCGDNGHSYSNDRAKKRKLSQIVKESTGLKTKQDDTMTNGKRLTRFITKH